MPAILSRTSCTASTELTSMSNIMMIMAAFCCAIERSVSMPLIEFTASSIGLMMSFSTDCAEAPG